MKPPMLVSASIAGVMLSSVAARLVTLEPNATFPDTGASVVKTYGPFDAGIRFNEAIVSWNVDSPAGAALKVEARAVLGTHETKWYTVGDWAADTKLHPRASVEGQRDQDGTVETDTLSLKAPADKLEVQVTMSTLAAGPKPVLKFLSVCFSDTGVATEDTAAKSPAWGKVIDVPERAQNNYPNGGVLCSATSVSMLLDFYSKFLNRPELDHDVPEVEAGVWDSVYKGAGNWPFNTAFAGSFPGMRAYVSRFSAIADLEKWIDAGFPVACSVSFDMLRGKPLSPDEQGHLVVLVGFTPEGDPIFNDPAFTDQVRKPYKRSDFEKAWLYSHRTVYLVYPSGARIPDPTGELWASP